MIYFFILLLLFYFAPLEKLGLRDVYIAIVFFLLITFQGVRWETGTDWDSYIEYFKYLDNYRNFEIGYVLENELVRLFTDNYTIFLFFNGALALLPVAWFLRKESSGSIVLGVSIFYSYYYLITYFGASRRIIAIGLCVLAAAQLLENRHKFALSLILVGSCFHYSALLSVFYFPLFRYRPSVGNMMRFSTVVIAAIGLIYLLLPLLMSVSIFSHIFVRVGEYLIGDTSVDGYDKATLSMLSIAKRSVMVLFIIYTLFKSKDRIGSREVFFSNCYFFSFVVYLVSEFALNDIFKTFTIYFSVFEIILIPNLIRMYEPRWRIFLYGLLFPYVILQTYSATFGNPFVDLYIPYRLAPDFEWLGGW
ncbi:EpsG family protein [Chromobacterium violaceum]|uniref:EpsG family protein n=1 Tax=Chromobacterium violaceum TaxID=536 RepID=UPI001CE19BEB|nr:EpsG family protein [Chromobacterium violaceum]